MWKTNTININNLKCFLVSIRLCYSNKSKGDRPLTIICFTRLLPGAGFPWSLHISNVCVRSRWLWLVSFGQCASVFEHLSEKASYFCAANRAGLSEAREAASSATIYYQLSGFATTRHDTLGFHPLSSFQLDGWEEHELSVESWKRIICG